MCFAKTYLQTQVTLTVAINFLLDIQNLIKFFCMLINNCCVLMYVQESKPTANVGVSFKIRTVEVKQLHFKEASSAEVFISIIMKEMGPCQEQHCVSWVLCLCIKSSLYSVLQQVLKRTIKTHKNLFIRGFYINVYLRVSQFEHLYCTKTACMGSATQRQHTISITLQ